MDKIEYLIGDSSIEKESFLQLNSGMLPPFSDEVCEFLDVLSKKIMKSAEARKYQDVVALGFWCRKANILQLKSRYEHFQNRLGRGLAFHIAPSNVPINTYYTLFWGLLSGYRNIVRSTNKSFEQIDFVADCINDILYNDFAELRKYICVVRYEKYTKWTEYFSGQCMLRVIWGGDETIENITKYRTNARCKDLKFADRYSFLVIDADAMQQADMMELKDVARKLYNDTFLNDQNACSTPHLFFWLKKDASVNIEEVKNRFWEAFYNESKKYDLAESKCTEKYTHLCYELMCRNNVVNIKRYSNRIYRCVLNEIPDDVEMLRGKFGMFYEYESTEVFEILSKLSVKTQTCLFYGELKYNLMRVIEEHGMTCIDRIVPIGKSLDISELWDGYDIFGEMTRVIVNE